MKTPQTDALVAAQNAKSTSASDPIAFLQESLNEMTRHAGEMEGKCGQYHALLQEANQSNCNLQHELAEANMCRKGLEQTIEILRGKLEEADEDRIRLDWLTKRGGMAVDYHTTSDGRKTNAYHFGSAVFTNDGLRAAIDAALEVEAKMAKRDDTTPTQENGGAE